MKLFLSIFLLSSLLYTVSAQSYQSFEYIVKKSIDHRQSVIDAFSHMEKLNKKDYVLKEKDISFLNEKIVKTVKFEDAVFHFMNDVSHLVKKRVKKKKPVKHSDLIDTMTYLGVALTIYDTFLATHMRINKLKKVRRFLNTKDQAIGKKKNLFRKTIKRYISFKFRRHMKRAMRVFERNYIAKKNKHEGDHELEAIAAVIQNSYSYQKLVGQSFWGSFKDFFKTLKRKWSVNGATAVDFINRLGKKTVFVLSRGFGNTAGMFQSRRGKLFNDHDFVELTRSYSRPLDIILEKTPFRLTDKFIPGYWGHAAIYIGNQVQLMELGVWDHPVVVKFHEEIKLGRTIVEALRPGVEINSFKRFSDIDDFVLLRQRKDWDETEAKEHILRALRQVGKTYDFGFDVETPDSIVCSELHYTVFRNLTFNTTKILGRYTINVDQVSQQGLASREFAPHILFIDGKRITKKIQETYDAIFDNANDNKKLKSVLKEIQSENEDENLEKESKLAKLDLALM